MGIQNETSEQRGGLRQCPKRPYQPVDEVLGWSSTHNMSWPELQRPTLCSGVIAEQRLRQRAVMARQRAADMSGLIIQFGTSRFLQAHVDLFVHEARQAGQ